MKKTSLFYASVAFMLFINNFNSTALHAQRVGVNVQIYPPYWAPYYDNVDRVQYYYLPDIEVYYDVYNQEFVYPENGNWMFAPQLPPYYSYYDFNHPFVVLLDYNVHEPWMHDSFYLQHYPKYYYRSLYRNSYNDPARPIYGFNENARVILYRNPNGRVANHEYREPVNRERAVESKRAPQRMEHNGRNVGQPVKVQKEMRRPSDGKGGREDHDRRN